MPKQPQDRVLGLAAVPVLSLLVDDEAKEQLFAKGRAGMVRVLIHLKRQASSGG